MQLPASQIEKAVSTEQSRYTLRAIKLDVEKKQLIATDGHILAIIPAEVTPDDHSALIPVEAIKAARKLGKEKRNKFTPPTIATNGKVTVSDSAGALTFEQSNGTFPNYDSVVERSPKTDGAPTISFNADLLMNLAQAIGSKNHAGVLQVALWIKDGSSAFTVKVQGSEESLGIIMPMRW